MNHFIFCEEKELVVNRTIDWLKFYDIEFNKFFDFNTDESSSNYDFANKAYAFKFGGLKNSNKEVSTIDKNNLDIIQGIWFRRPLGEGEHMISPIDYMEKALPTQNFLDSVKGNLNVFWDFIGYKLSNINHIGSFKKFELNKPIVLQKAIALGLTIPRTLITNSKEELTTFLQECNNKVITKPMHEIVNGNLYDVDKETKLSIYQITKEVSDFGDQTPNVFGPSLFQEHIEKQYEIRAIVLDGKIYSGAIFSQLDENTKVDMRNREGNMPLRYIPYKLPCSIEKKVFTLMKEVNLNFGIFDFMKSKDGKYYFLEINPVGQYGDVSSKCNYNLYKKIAELLIQK